MTGCSRVGAACFRKLNSMCHYREIYVSERAGVLILNGLVGLTPVTIPRFLAKVESLSFADESLVFTSTISVCAQLLLYLVCAASPGQLIARMSVRNVDGSPASFKSLMIRCCPYLLAYASVVLFPEIGWSAESTFVQRAMIGYLFVNGFYHLFLGDCSLTDRLTKTRVCKYSLVWDGNIR